MTADQVALIDWDESHVDVPDLDLVLPENAAGLDDGAYDLAAQASAAWEAAVCWDDEYAVKRLAEVRAVLERVRGVGSSAVECADLPPLSDARVAGTAMSYAPPRGDTRTGRVPGSS
jgi:hypothetical protein